jgi:NAD(P)-dependent dehydrogenase (short-subunit alcohol dehydrogenase family)
MLSFSDRAALVTGAAHGIGRGIAELLAELGARVIALDCDQPALADVFAGAPVTTFAGDLGADGAEQLAQEIWDRHGPIELLVNNVGIHTDRQFFELDAGGFDATFNTNLRGPWFFTKRIAHLLIEQRTGGAIVFVSSLHDHVVGTYPAYSASKAAVSMLVKELASVMAPYGIRVNAISPGVVRTSSNPVGGDAPIRGWVPLGRIGEPADIARMVAILLSDEWAGYVTGVNVPVDGGLGLSSWSTALQRTTPDHKHRPSQRLFRRSIS